MTTVHAEFLRRLELIPTYGLGLSVDLYTPDLHGLRSALGQHSTQPEYLEVFRATPTALTALRKVVGEETLTYHGEGLWLTQPNAKEDPLFTREVFKVARELEILQSAWMNHECATKQMAGFTFGTYLPPLYTASSAEIVAENTYGVQTLFDRHCRLATGGTPLMLLELPPLTYFATGTLSIPTFFRLVTERVSCGLVLDIGHLWTVYRYTGAWRTTGLPSFVEEFLAEFPLERVVEIHVAGLAVHESTQAAGGELERSHQEGGPPLWTDAHAAPIPPLLFEILDQVLDQPRLTNLRGLALEVDAKPVELIVQEFSQFSERYGTILTPCPPPVVHRNGISHSERRPAAVPVAIRDVVEAAYERYAWVLSGRTEPHDPAWTTNPAWLEELDLYRSRYLPFEILHWGGDLTAMFPETCRILARQAVPLSRFVSFWVREPRPPAGAYDFFLIKIERFLEFIHEAAPDYEAIAGGEAEVLREAYRSANEPALPAHAG